MSFFGKVKFFSALLVIWPVSFFPLSCSPKRLFSSVSKVTEDCLSDFKSFFDTSAVLLSSGEAVLWVLLAIVSPDRERPPNKQDLTQFCCLQSERPE